MKNTTSAKPNFHKGYLFYIGMYNALTLILSFLTVILCLVPVLDYIVTGKITDLSIAIAFSMGIAALNTTINNWHRGERTRITMVFFAIFSSIAHADFTVIYSVFQERTEILYLFMAFGATYLVLTIIADYVSLKSAEPINKYIDKLKTICENQPVCFNEYERKKIQSLIQNKFTLDGKLTLSTVLFQDTDVPSRHFFDDLFYFMNKYHKLPEKMVDDIDGHKIVFLQGKMHILKQQEVEDLIEQLTN